MQYKQRAIYKIQPYRLHNTYQRHRSLQLPSYVIETTYELCVWDTATTIILYLTVMIKIRQYTAISVIVNIVYIVDDRDPSILQRSTINNCNCNKTKGVWDTTINSRVVSYIMPTLNDIGQRSLPSQILYPPRLVVGWSHTIVFVGFEALRKLWACTQRYMVSF